MFKLRQHKPRINYISFSAFGVPMNASEFPEIILAATVVWCSHPNMVAMVPKQVGTHYISAYSTCGRATYEFGSCRSANTHTHSPVAY